MIFDKQYEVRLQSWKDFRVQLETDPEPYYSALRLFDSAPKVKYLLDPWNNKDWPDPWELIYDNQYCDVAVSLGICYTLQLTNKFENSDFEIWVTQTPSLSRADYLIHVDNTLINWNDSCLNVKELPVDTVIQERYKMKKLS